MYKRLIVILCGAVILGCGGGKKPAPETPMPVFPKGTKIREVLEECHGAQDRQLMSKAKRLWDEEKIDEYYALVSKAPYRKLDQGTSVHHINTAYGLAQVYIKGKEKNGWLWIRKECLGLE